MIAYQLWIECILYCKIVALNMLNDINQIEKGRVDIPKMIRGLLLAEQCSVMTELKTGMFYCLRKD